MTKVFLSHTAEDSQFARRLGNALRDLGVGVEDIDGIRLGDNIRMYLRRVLSEATAIIVLISPSTVDSEWVAFEIGAGIASEKTIIPVLVEGVTNSSLPDVLSEWQYIDATNRPLADVASAIEKRVAKIAD